MPSLPFLVLFNKSNKSISLFLSVKATLLAIIFAFLGRSYPFIPIQLTLTSVVTIGIPSFVLALEPNNERINGRISRVQHLHRPSFVKRGLSYRTWFSCNCLYKEFKLI